MSLGPFICCPECGSAGGLERVGVVGAPTSRDHKGPKDSKIVRCKDCNITFRTDGATLYEVMGRDGWHDTPF